MRTAPLYRFYSIRDEYPGLYPADRGPRRGTPSSASCTTCPCRLLRTLLASEPPELELSIVELARGQLSFGMILRDEEQRQGGYTDISQYGGWRAYRAALGDPARRMTPATWCCGPGGW